MSEVQGRDGSIYLRHEHGEFQLTIQPCPLLPGGHDFREGNLLITNWGGLLPPVGFSAAMFKIIEKLAVSEQLTIEEAPMILARYLLKRTNVTPMQFNPTMGCWDMELLGGEKDAKGRARYPAGSLKKLGYMSGRTGMHQITYEVFRGVKIPIIESTHAKRVRRTDVDHLCRRHACCNPFHLQAVPPEENTIRGNSARRALIQPHMYALVDGEQPYAEVLGHYTEYGLGGRSQKPRLLLEREAAAVEIDDHPALFE